MFPAFLRAVYCSIEGVRPPISDLFGRSDSKRSLTLEMLLILGCFRISPAPECRCMEGPGDCAMQGRAGAAKERGNTSFFELAKSQWSGPMRKVSSTLDKSTTEEPSIPSHL
jgi:hypothetical protein